MSLREIARLPSNAVELNGEQSRQVLEQTLRPGVPIRMVGASDEAPVTARVRTVTNSTIELQVEWTADRTCPITPGACCVSQLGLSDDQFGFTTRVQRVVDHEDFLQVDLERPKLVWVRQRRRFRRAIVRQSSTVECSRREDGSTCGGPILNVSADGLACIVHRADADRLAVGDRLHIRFALEGNSDPLTLEADVMAKTPASDPSRTIIGLQFDESTMSKADHWRLQNGICAAP